MGKRLPDSLGRTLTYALWAAVIVILLLGVLSLVLRHLVRQRTAQLRSAYNRLERLSKDLCRAEPVQSGDRAQQERGGVVSASLPRRGSVRRDEDGLDRDAGRGQAG